MKVSCFSTMIILMTLSSIFFIPPIQCTLSNQDLVQEICQKTPNSQLCLLTLRSNLNSQHYKSDVEDVSKFAHITLEVIAARAPLILRQLQSIDEQTDHTPLKNCVDSCIISYTKITNEIMPQAIELAHKGDLNGAKEKATLVQNLAYSCEKDCSGSISGEVSPVGDSNQYVQDMCEITVSMITNFPKSNQQTVA
ncbi:unnamed protein product [Trifolium pratense]|uniref:Uncharacterized protein n=1 Tax=Trifolium pratense TaxID=57577 RepID=A0ACB0L1Z1_TRIPR|nr:unnamed protein product [Trifolium pratense]